MTPSTHSILLGLGLCCVATWAADTTAAVRTSSDLGPAEGERLQRERRAVRLKAGSCPLDLDYPRCDAANSNVTSLCHTDSDCPGRKKCCSSGCRARCIHPLQRKMGGCPSFDSSVCLSAKPLPDECHRDEQCEAGERCCCAKCRRQCTSPVRVKPGQCPPKPVRLGRLCQNDNECAVGNKCCEYNEKRCVKPIAEHRGYCPFAKEQLSCGTVLDPPLCRSDIECPLQQKCCVSENKMQCVNSLREKPGECQVGVKKCVYPIQRSVCRVDRNCQGAKKCCTPKCSQECMDPVIIKPGQCPVNTVTNPCPTPSPPSLCESDTHCPDNKKCCDYNCAQQCVAPLAEDGVAAKDNK